MAAGTNANVSDMDKQLFDDEGRVDRAAVIERLRAHRWEANETYPDGVSAAEFERSPAVQETIYALASGKPVAFRSQPGIGKTSFIRWVAEDVLGVEFAYLPAQVLAPEDTAVPMPQTITDTPDGQPRKVLDHLIKDKLSSERPKILFVDEAKRAKAQVRNQLFEIVQEGTVMNKPIPNLLAVVAADNDAEEAGIRAKDDLAYETRWSTTVLGTHDVPWMYALADKYSDVDLSRVFKRYTALSEEVKTRFSPRALDRLIWNVLRGHPPQWALPMPSGPRVRLLDGDVDKTEEILSGFCSDLDRPYREGIPEPMEAAMRAAFEEGRNLYLQGPPGVGKTARLKAEVRRIGAQEIYFSGPTLTVDGVAVPFPDEGQLTTLVLRHFVEDDGRDKVVFLDEIWRAPRAVRNLFLEILQEGSIAGVPITRLRTVVAANNPREYAGLKMDVGTPDAAQMDRFWMSLSVEAAETGAFEYLLSTYGEGIEPFVEWWKEDLDPKTGARAYVSPRVLESMYTRHTFDRPLEDALPVINQERVPVRLIDLEKRLADRPTVRLRKVANEVDDYERKLGDDDPHASVEVTQAFKLAEVSQLEEQYEACVRLVWRLPQQLKTALILGAGDQADAKRRQQFWGAAIRAKGDPSAYEAEKRTARR